MIKIAKAVIITLLAAGALAAPASASDWPQFRGPKGTGRPTNDAQLPTELGPATNVLWKTALPPGHSSPVVVGDRVYLTAVKQKRLFTVSLDRQSGKILWEAEAPARTLEAVHKIGSHAQPTPAADQECVVSFFGSAGLFCHDRDGKLLWQRLMGPFHNDFGAGSSPILVGDWVILCQDHDENSFLLALEKRTGKIVWKTDRSEFLRGFATPVIWEVAGRKQVVVAGTLRVAGYDLQSGKEIWTVRGIARTICATPVVGDDGRLYLSGWAAGGDPGAAIAVEPFDDAIKDRDKSGNGKLELGELNDHPFFPRFTQVDTNGDGFITRAEYERFRNLFQKGRNAVLAVNPGGKGDVTASHVAWSNRRQVPFCASPLFYDGLVYTVKDGGLFASLDPRDGQPLKFARLPDAGNYYSSPVAGDGKIYVLNESGSLAVIQAGRDWKVLSRSDFGEHVYATPAIADGRIYLRTTGHLYCFGKAADLPKPRLPRDNLLVYRGADGKPVPVKTVADWAKRRAEVIRGMESVMGNLPGKEKRCPLDMKVIEEFDGGTYVRRLITYASEPGGRVPAYLLIPKDVLAGKRKAPAILCLHGTNNQIGHGVVVGLGKTPNRGYALELAKRGYVTLAPNYPLLAKYQPDLKKLGWESGTLKAVWDNIRGLDLLASLPFVDSSRGFGTIGHSLGGHNSVYTAVFDDRLKAVVSSCGLDSYVDYYNGNPKNWDPERGWCQTRYMRKLATYKGRLADIPFDFHEMIGALAPRDLLIIAPKKDSNFRADSVDRIIAAARPVFKLYGHEDRLRVEHPDCAHDFPPQMREAAYRLFDRVLRGK